MLDLPVGTYGAAFAPDGRQIIYTASRGLGFGSEMGFFDLTIGVHTVWRTDPYHVFAFPTWSPNGEQIAYILMADSNIYQVEIATGEKTQLTSFDQTMVYDIAWSPYGRQLAFTAQDGIWVVEPGQAPIRVSPPATVARHPVWLVEPAPSE